MTKPKPGTPKSESTGKDADRLIASYGRAIEPEKKAKLMAQLSAERANFTQRNAASPSKTVKGSEQGRSR